MKCAALFSPRVDRFVKIVGALWLALLFAPAVVHAQPAASSVIAPSVSPAPNASPTNPANASAATPTTATPFRLNIGLEGTGQTGEVSVALQIVVIMTLLS